MLAEIWRAFLAWPEHSLTAFDNQNWIYSHFAPQNAAADTLDLQRAGFSAEALAKFVQERTDIQFRIVRPPSYSGIMVILLLGALVAGFLYMRRNNLEFLFNKRMWGVLALTFCMAMISGQMWNHIRSPPLLHRSPNGGISYIHGSSQAQLVIESYIVMFLSKCCHRPYDLRLPPVLTAQLL